MTFKLGLTGSIGMGKSTTAKLFAENGCAVWDADAAVHRLYARGGAAVAPIGRAFPTAVKDGSVSRDRLKALIAEDPHDLETIESIVHPLVARDRAAFVAGTDADITVLDIPLLFETGGDAQMDATVCVTVPAETQKDRVLARGTMTEDQFNAILSKQMLDEEKRARADFVIVTDTLEHARVQVQNILKDIRGRQNHA
ncbi:dephospho-CoA kinase [Roseovarius sp. SK2]|uniref:dephospho-CoA kinase n=1 Tax=Roseovarius TaxID=74030 RepID=UPI00237C43E7|nr:dephospho-CoA kinase [Roseovarius sp. SK2]MDD9725270.1 dephospho-CoA kinase [Roseovarius sp. SK2]